MAYFEGKKNRHLSSESGVNSRFFGRQSTIQQLLRCVLQTALPAAGAALPVRLRQIQQINARSAHSLQPRWLTNPANKVRSTLFAGNATRKERPATGEGPVSGSKKA